MNEEHSRRYAQLLVRRGVDLRSGQPLYIYGQAAHRDLIALLMEAGYEAGCGPVKTRMVDPVIHAALLSHGRFEDIENIHVQDQVWYSDIIRHGGAYICLLGPEIPHQWDDLARTQPERLALDRRGATSALAIFYRYGLEGQCGPWVVAACPTPGWAQDVFPHSSKAEAFDQLGELVFRFTYADREDAFELAEQRDRRLKARCRLLDELGITEVHVSGGQTDLRVGFSRQARWHGGCRPLV